MENNIISSEFDQMREQISLLKAKLSHQTIISEKHLMRTIRENVSKINRMRNFSIFCGIFAIIYCPVAFYKFGHSLSFVIGTEVMLIVCLVCTLWMHRKLDVQTLSIDNLVSLGAKIQTIKRHYANWIIISIPMIAAWFGWFAYDASRFLSAPIPFITAGLIGGVIAGVIGVVRHITLRREINQILDNINDLQEH